MTSSSGWRVTPIGIFRSDVREKSVAPRQPGVVPDNRGCIEVEPEYVDGLADLEGFERIWIVAWLDRAEGWRPLVRPPRTARQPTGRKGVFATRSPHRPNPIGLSCVRLERIEDGVVYVRGHDLIDATPVIDLKPYLPYADAHPDAAAGWVDDLGEGVRYDIDWCGGAKAQAAWLGERGVDLVSVVAAVLSERPHPAPNHRVRRRDGDADPPEWEFAHRTWRIDFRRDDAALRVTVLRIRSGYPPEVETSRWDDVPLHRAFRAESW